MRGKVLSFNGTTGLISGDDGKRYSFAKADLMDASHVAAGTSVDFEADGSDAHGVYIVPGVLSEKNKWIAALLCFFFGIWGVHKFYLGRTHAGIIMLLSGTVGWILILPGLAVVLISFIELIIYLVKSDQSFYEDYVVGQKSWF